MTIGGANDGAENRAGRAVIWILGGLMACAVLLLITARLGTELLWFAALGFRRVLLIEWTAKLLLFLGGAVVMGGAVAGSLALAGRRRSIGWWLGLPVGDSLPDSNPGSPADVLLGQYRGQLESLRHSLLYAIPLALGTFGGFIAASQWQTFMLAIHSVPFGVTDPQFGLDTGFYVFHLPLLNFLVGFLLGTCVLSFIAALVSYYLYGSFTFGPRTEGVPRASNSVRWHLGLLAALTLLLIGANLWLERYGLVIDHGNLYNGSSYTGIHAVLPGRSILAAVAVVAAILILVAIIRDNFKTAGAALGLVAVSALVLGSVYPAIVQRFKVSPNAFEYQAPYLQRNVAATIFGYKLDGFGTPSSGESAARNVNFDPADFPRELANSGSSNSMLLRASQDIKPTYPNGIEQSFRMLQQHQPYYDFPNGLVVEQYVLDGQPRDVYVAAREINLSGLSQADRNWEHIHTVLTHGYGLVAAEVDQSAAANNVLSPETTIATYPEFLEAGIPTSGEMTNSLQYEPRIYFSPYHWAYAVVGAPTGVAGWEMDYPIAGAGQATNAFPTNEVQAGPNIGTWWQKALFAIRFSDRELLSSDHVTSASQILFTKDPATRVAKVAPWLTLDEKVYPAVVDGRIKWIVDGYTTSNNYPYSELTRIPNSDTEMSVTKRPVNYIRNSVKATVDAYDGSVTLYAWDPADPLLLAWTDVFKETVLPLSEISGELMSHLRYPTDLFTTQATLLQQYHLTDNNTIAGDRYLWQAPPGLARTGNSKSRTSRTVSGQLGEELEQKPVLPAFYASLKKPENVGGATFSLASQIFSDWKTDGQLYLLSVNSDAGNVAGVKSKNYGTLNLWVLRGGENEYRLLDIPAITSAPHAVLKSGSTLAKPAASPSPVATASGRAGVGGSTPASPLASVAPTAPASPATTPSTPAETALDVALLYARQAYTDMENALRQDDSDAYAAAQSRLSKAIDRAISANEAKKQGR